jgi:2,3-bisphosphoglycerate-dependent phosphoglycerate mutase
MPWLVRHGESEANVGVATSDYAAISLTGRGQEQAERVAAACPPQPERVVLSPYRRARQTAEPLLRRFPGVHVEEQSVQEFTYLAADRCRGMTPEQRQPLVDAYWSRMNTATARVLNPSARLQRGCVHSSSERGSGPG